MCWSEITGFCGNFISNFFGEISKLISTMAVIICTPTNSDKSSLPITIQRNQAHSVYNVTTINKEVSCVGQMQTMLLKM